MMNSWLGGSLGGTAAILERCAATACLASRWAREKGGRERNEPLQEKRVVDRGVGCSGARLFMTTPAGTLGLPVKLLHECEGQIVTVELKTHEVYRYCGCWRCWVVRW